VHRRSLLKSLPFGLGVEFDPGAAELVGASEQYRPTPDWDQIRS
jgi:hypothetical protein